METVRHHGIPSKLVSLIKSNYEGMTRRVIDEGQFSRQFRVQTGVRQGCLLSPFLFMLVIDWIMKMTTKQRRNGIQWTLWSQLDDLDFADDLAFPYPASSWFLLHQTFDMGETNCLQGILSHNHQAHLISCQSANICFV